MKPVFTTFNDLYLHELQLLASAELQSIAALPKLVKATETVELQRALSAHLESCREQLTTLKQLLKEVRSEGEYLICSGMEALLGECVAVLAEYPEGNLRDAVMIAHMQRADHYKVAAYGSISEYAKLLGFKEAALLLDHAAKAVGIATKTLGVIGIQVNAEAYVDTRVTELPMHEHDAARP